MAISRLEQLFYLKLDGKLSPEERGEFHALILNKDNEEELNSLIGLVSENPGDLVSLDNSTALAILETIMNSSRPEAPVLPIVRKFGIWRAAAAILILVLGSYFLFFNRTPEATENKPAVSVNLPSPGTNKAVLTLANGSSIQLDSSALGIVARQGNAKIVRLDSGRLAYTVNSEKPDNTAISFNTLTTPRGGQFQLLLPDGTKVWLDAASSITYPTAFVGKTRSVSVTGQVYFEVSHNAAQPFVVRVNGLEINDLGTAFNINAYAEENRVRTTLIAGAVSVNNGKKQLTLKPGEQAENSATEMKLISDVDLESVVAWKEGEFRFDHVDFATLMRQISRWYDIDIAYQGSVPDKHFWGSMNRNVSLSRLQEVMRNYGVDSKLVGNKLTILK